MRRLLWAVIVLSLIPAAAGQDTTYLTMRFDAAGDTVSGVQLMVIEETLFQTDALFVGDTPQDAGFSWRLSDANGKVLPAGAAYPSFNNRVEFNPAAARLEILKDGVVAHSQRLSFCDSDGECEPCGERGPDLACRLMENSLTCTDCPSGGADDYCDLFEDGVCDPDCEGLDADCPGCTPGACYYHDSWLDRTSCVEDLKGEICDPLARCTGRSAYADDSGSRCCIEGTCFLPAGVPPAPVRDWCSSLGGVVCAVGTQCAGEVRMPDYAELRCCVSGGCVPIVAENETLPAGIPDKELRISQDVLESPYLIGALIAIELMLLALIIFAARRRKR